MQVQRPLTNQAVRLLNPLPLTCGLSHSRFWRLLNHWSHHAREKGLRAILSCVPLGSFPFHSWLQLVRPVWSSSPLCEYAGSQECVLPNGGNSWLMALPSISVSGGSWPGISYSLGEFGVLSTISCPVASCSCAVCSFAMGCRRLTELETLGAGFQGGWLGCALCFCGSIGLVCLLIELVGFWYCLSDL